MTEAKITKWERQSQPSLGTKLPCVLDGTTIVVGWHYGFLLVCVLTCFCVCLLRKHLPTEKHTNFAGFRRKDWCHSRGQACTSFCCSALGSTSLWVCDSFGVHSTKLWVQQVLRFPTLTLAQSLPRGLQGQQHAFCSSVTWRYWIKLFLKVLSHPEFLWLLWMWNQSLAEAVWKMAFIEDRDKDGKGSKYYVFLRILSNIPFHLPL